MSFIAAPPEDASPAGAKVKCGDFWPDIDLNDARDVMKIGGPTIPDARLISAIEAAVITALGDLSDWQDVQIAKGYEALRDVPSKTLGKGTLLTASWKRAVYAYASAELNETGRDLTVTKIGADRADENASLADAFRRNGLFAVRKILGINHVTSELI